MFGSDKTFSQIVESGRYYESDGSDTETDRLGLGSNWVELLETVSNPSSEKGRTKYKEDIADDGARE